LSAGRVTGRLSPDPGSTVRLQKPTETLAGAALAPATHHAWRAPGTRRPLPFSGLVHGSDRRRRVVPKHVTYGRSANPPFDHVTPIAVERESSGTQPIAA